MARLYALLALSAWWVQAAIAADPLCLVFTTGDMEDDCNFEEHSCVMQCVEAGFAIDTTTDVSDINAVIQYDSIKSWGKAQCCNCPQVLSTEVTVENTQNCNTIEDCVLHYTYTLKNDTSRTCKTEVEVDAAQGGECELEDPKTCGAPAAMGAALALGMAAVASAMLLFAA